MSANMKPRIEDDDDLDDLDDVVDQFSTELSQSEVAPYPFNSASTTSVASSSSKSQEKAEEVAEADEFSQKFAEEMLNLMQELGLQASSEEGNRNHAWEKMLIDGMNEVDVASNKTATSSSASLPSSKDDFQQSIRQAMDKLKGSESFLKPKGISEDPSDPLEQLLSQFTGEFDGLDTDENLQGILETMMQQLMSKDILYEPLKELNDKFPRYLDDHEATMSTADKSRYYKQIQCVRKIVAAFEDPAYDDKNPQKTLIIVNLMNEMQTYGAPPEEIMGPLPDGLNFGADGVPAIPDNCVIS